MLPRKKTRIRPIQDEFGTFLRDIWKETKEKVLRQVLDHLELSLRAAHARFVGKTVAVIGPPKAGKTTLLKVLREPLIRPEEFGEYATTEVNFYRAFKVQFNLPVSNGKQIRFRFKVRKNSDVGGEEYVREAHWRDAIEGAAVVVYVADAGRLFEPSPNHYRRRIISDFDWIFDHLQLLKPNFSVVLAVNKIDLLCNREGYREFANTHASDLTQLHDDIAARWSDYYRGNLKGIPLLSLMDLGLRNFTLTDLVASFAGESLLQLYNRNSKPSSPEM
jgi:GTPase SAR1 family protein